MSETTAENFPSSDCILSDKKPSSRGYAFAYDKSIGRVTGHHRLAWKQANGPIPEGLMVLHRCDVRNCINVEHLFLGTNADNLADMANKGRARNQNMDTTHCQRGHEFTEENTLRYNGKRHCRACGALRSWQGRQHG